MDTALTPLSASPHDFQTKDDFALINTLMRSSRYDIPERLRKKIIGMASNKIEDESAEFPDQLSAAKLILECDKRNMDLLKIAMPTKVEHLNVQKASTEVLREAITEALKLMPTIDG